MMVELLITPIYWIPLALGLLSAGGFFYIYRKTHDTISVANLSCLALFTIVAFIPVANIFILFFAAAITFGMFMIQYGGNKVVIKKGTKYDAKSS